MNVLDDLLGYLKEKRLHMTLLDPDEQTPEKAADISEMAVSIGTDAIMLGGSTGVTHELLDRTVLSIKERVEVPVILFPTTASAVSLKADAIYFMSLLNSRNPRFITGEQMKASLAIKKSGLEAISMGYIIVEPGMEAGQVGEANLVGKDDAESAVGYAVAGELLGMDLIYLEAGSGATEPVPTEMIKAVKEHLDIPILVGGGIRTGDKAKRALDAGADIIVTGTIVEEQGISDAFREIVACINDYRDRF